MDDAPWSPKLRSNWNIVILISFQRKSPLCERNDRTVFNNFISSYVSTLWISGEFHRVSEIAKLSPGEKEHDDEIPQSL